jgi:hypothetical protein
MELMFPTKGLVKGAPSSKQPQQTSQDLNNVRPYFDGRLVGGQRPGLDKMFTQQIGGESSPIVWLGSITTVD